MYCVHKKKWDRLNKDQKKQFRISHLHEETPFERAMRNA